MTILQKPWLTGWDEGEVGALRVRLARFLRCRQKAEDQVGGFLVALVNYSR